MSPQFRRIAPRTLRAALGASVVAAACVPALALADEAGTRPPQCASHFKDRDVRERTVKASEPGGLLHEMSDRCFAAGQNIGTMSLGSQFRLYYADTGQPGMCYGYSVQLQRNGYVYCPVVAP